MLINPLTVYLPDDLSRRRMSHRIFVALSPAMLIGGMASGLMAAIVIAAAVGGRRVYPRDFVGHMLVGWLLIRLGAALLGTLHRMNGFPT